MAMQFKAERKEIPLLGYFMRHKAGGDVGFSWDKDDANFSDEWERIPATPAEQPSQVASESIDTPEFRALAVQWKLCLTTEIQKTYAALVAHIDAWGARRAGDASSTKD